MALESPTQMLGSKNKGRNECSSMPHLQESKRSHSVITRAKNANDIRALIVILTITFGAAALGVAFGSSDKAAWYVALTKPSWTPPGQVFGVAWTLLYGLMSFAAWRVYLKRKTHDIKPAMWCYFLQLIFNALWSPLFFGLHNPALALIDIVVLQFFIISSAATFSQVDRPAAAMLIPYMAWVAFAICLNCFIWVAN